MKLSVISPTLNEAQNIETLVDQLQRALGNMDYEILIVDDNSPDLTWSVAEQISLKNPRVRILRRMKNPGLGMAVVDGFSAAEGDVLACIDADLQHDPSILPRMIEELQSGVQIVVGSRHVKGGGFGKWSRWRRFESWCANKAAQLLLGFEVKDLMSGYFLVWREDFNRVQQQLSESGFKILLEILAKLRTARVKEVPYTFRPRAVGQSKLSSRIVLLYFQQLWRLCGESRRAPVRLLKFSADQIVGVFGASRY
ncbi:MAG TPA: polyprenol monophosphomannose synthase [Candidatus Acidoferrales bacterium]|jgi:dolichol-phosphate mannosyltransferase|nr:polyprenol monophosphomannose synthase [Candidatus Acidoferrales bacterium]